MVNTFLTDSNFRKSAKSLDRSRLGKQRLEAYQILCLCENLNLLSMRDIPENKYEKKIWIKEIVARYNQGEYYYIVDDGKLLSRTIQPIVLKNNQIISKSDNTVTIKINEVRNLNDVVLPEQRLVKFGFVYHPSILMWLGYEDALKQYINEHIDEWISRGYKNTMMKYNLPKDILYPPWIYDELLHQNHQSSLLNKEITRNEKPWYIFKFPNATQFIDYIWP